MYVKFTLSYTDKILEIAWKLKDKFKSKICN